MRTSPTEIGKTEQQPELNDTEMNETVENEKFQMAVENMDQVEEKNIVYINSLMNIVQYFAKKGKEFMQDLKTNYGQPREIKRISKRSCILVSCNSLAQKENLLKCSKINGLSVTVTRPYNEQKATYSPDSGSEQETAPERERNTSIRKCVIKNVPIGYEDIDLVQHTGARYVNRMHKRTEGYGIIPLNTVILAFEGEIPSTVTIDYIQYTTAPYYPLPTYCTRCQRYGHVNSTCTSKKC